MTLESSLPWLSLVAAVGAGWASAARPDTTLERGLKALALGALAAFAYLRGIAPGALGVALVLSAAGQFLRPRERARFATGSSFLLFGAWAAFAFLFLRESGGAALLTSDPLRTLAAAVAIAAGGALLWFLRRDMGESWIAAATDVGVLVLMLAAAATLDAGMWPAMLGAAAVFAAEAGNLWRSYRAPAVSGGPLATGLWGLNFLGQAAMAYVFLR